eukprot:scaffold1411_cov252-Pinguiococcus_pyrenoidosus.AAC.6
MKDPTISESLTSRRARPCLPWSASAWIPFSIAASSSMRPAVRCLLRALLGGVGLATDYSTGEPAAQGYHPFSEVLRYARSACQVEAASCVSAHLFSINGVLVVGQHRKEAANEEIHDQGARPAG